MGWAHSLITTHSRGNESTPWRPALTLSWGSAPWFNHLPYDLHLKDPLPLNTITLGTKLWTHKPLGDKSYPHPNHSRPLCEMQTTQTTNPKVFHWDAAQISSGAELVAGLQLYLSQALCWSRSPPWEMHKTTHYTWLSEHSYLVFTLMTQCPRHTISDSTFRRMDVKQK